VTDQEGIKLQSVIWVRPNCPGMRALAGTFLRLLRFLRSPDGGGVLVEDEPRREVVLDCLKADREVRRGRPPEL
jgi:hypothetical protein